MTIVITKGDNPGNYIYVDVNADFATYRTKYAQRKTKWFMGSNGINVQMDINHCDI